MNTDHEPFVRFGFVLAFCAWLFTTTPSIAAPPGYTVVPVHEGLAFPTAIRFAPDGRLFYLERDGNVMVFDSDADPTPSLWAAIPTANTGDRGLLGIEFHPSFPDSPYVYFYHSNPSPQMDRVVRMRDQGGVGTDYVVLREFAAPNDAHHGGRLKFGPDGALWLTGGDNSDSNNGQSTTSIRGKLLRFTTMGQNAPGNPYASGAGYVMGVRNSFGICFDPVNGRGYFTDNGDECDDELNLIEAGANYGWGPTDGCNGQPAGTRLPLRLFNPVFAPVSCVVVRGSLMPQLSGQLLFGGFNDGLIRRVVFAPGSDGTVVDSVVTFHDEGFGLLDIILGNDGKLWFSTYDTIFRIDPPPPTSVDPVSIAAPRLRVSPNPFVRGVTIGVDGGAGSIDVFDLSSRSVRRWTNASIVSWDGRDAAGHHVAPGVYLVRAVMGGAVEQARLVRLGP